MANADIPINVTAHELELSVTNNFVLENLVLENTTVATQDLTGDIIKITAVINRNCARYTLTSNSIKVNCVDANQVSVYETNPNTTYCIKFSELVYDDVSKTGTGRLIIEDVTVNDDGTIVVDDYENIIATFETDENRKYKVDSEKAYPYNYDTQKLQGKINNIHVPIDSALSSDSENPIMNKVVSQNCANAVKGSGTGTALLFDDVSPISHKVNLSGVANTNVTVYGKNLWPTNMKFADQELNGLSLVNNSDGTITISGTPTATTSLKVSTYTAGYVVLPKGEYVAASILSFNALNLSGALKQFFGGKIKATETIKLVQPYIFFGNDYVGKEVNITFKPLLMLGTMYDEEYEPYKTPTTYLLNDNGSTEIDSVSPNMTILADNNVSAKYNQDIAFKINTIAAKQDKKIILESIEEITTTEEISLFVRSAEPDGTTYKFDRLKVLIDLPAASAKSSFVTKIQRDPSSRWLLYYNNAEGITTSKRKYSFECYKSYGYYETTIMSTTGVNDYALPAKYGQVPAFWEVDESQAKNIGYLRIEGNLPIGTKITILGVRA